MIRPNLKNHLTQRYADKSLPSNTVDRLRALAGVDQFGPGRIIDHHHASFWWPRLYGLSAEIAVIVAGASFDVVLTPVPRRSEMDAVLTELRRIPVYKNEDGRTVVPRLVAVSFQADGCPFAVAVEPVFLELAEKYGDKPIIFTRFDMTSDTTLRRSRNLACGLGIDWMYEGPY